MLLLKGNRRDHIQRAAELLAAGGVVAFPTETVYGLGAHAFLPRAIARIFALKERPPTDPLIVHLASLRDLPRVASEIPPRALRLAEAFWPGPLTLVLQKREDLPSLVTAQLPSVAVRVPSHPVAQALLQTLKAPIAAPSANRFGRLSPTLPEHVLSQIQGMDALLDGGGTPLGIESTVISFLHTPPRCLRVGALPMETLRRVVKISLPPRKSNGEEERSGPTIDLPALSPGTSSRHYAPQTPLYLRHTLALSSLDLASTAYLAFSQKPRHPFAHVEILSPRGDLEEASRALFAALYRLDQKKLSCIVAELVPEKGLGRAINDRLRRAARPRGSKVP